MQLSSFNLLKERTFFLISHQRAFEKKIGVGYKSSKMYFVPFQGVQFNMIKKISPCFPVGPVLMLLVVFTANLVVTIPFNPSLRNKMRFERLEGNSSEL